MEHPNCDTTDAELQALRLECEAKDAEIQALRWECAAKDQRIWELETANAALVQQDEAVVQHMRAFQLHAP